jgi:hypothetical protein
MTTIWRLQNLRYVWHLLNVHGITSVTWTELRTDEPLVAETCFSEDEIATAKFKVSK